MHKKPEVDFSLAFSQMNSELCDVLVVHQKGLW